MGLISQLTLRVVPATFTEDSATKERLQFITEYLVKAWLKCGKKIYLDFCPLGQGYSNCQHVCSSLFNKLQFW